MSWAWLNGETVPEGEARIAATDEGLLFARGVFETFRARAGRPVYRLDGHLRRMKDSAAVIGVPPPPTIAQIPDAVAALLDRSGLDDARVRVTLTAGPPGGAPALLVQARAVSGYPESLYESGAAAVIVRTRRNETSPLCGVKSLNYLDNVLAREEAGKAGATEALLLNTQGRVAEGSAFNVFAVKDGRVTTPPLSEGALPGITRAAVLDLAADEGIAAEEAPLALDDVHGADELFITNAVAGVLPVTSLDGATVGDGAPGRIARALLSRYRREAGWG